MKVVIIEDEKIAAEHLKQSLADTGKDIHVVAMLDSVTGAVEWFRNHAADLIFMDIQLGDDLSFSIFNQIELQTPVIFISAYEHYALKAFKVNSIDYLLKPIHPKELRTALDKFEKQNLRTDLTALIRSMRKPEPEYQKRFMISTGQRIRAVETSGITCFVAEGRYVSLYLTDGSKHLTNHTLDWLETVLDPVEFFRINRSIIIRFGAIAQMHTYTKSRIKIDLQPDPGIEVIVSIDRSGAFKRWLNR